MSTSTMKRLSPEALALSEPELAELALELIRSLDAPAEEGVEEAWNPEIVRRIAQIDISSNLALGQPNPYLLTLLRIQ